MRRTIWICLVCALPIIAFCCIFGYAIRISGGAEEFPIAWFMIIAAILGALVNQTFRKVEQAQILSYSWWQKFLYVIWKSGIAIVFAFALYFLFISGLVSGDIFPNFVNTTVEQGGVYTNMKDFATKVDPESFKDVAKILVWSFIAGYSEWFVPNLISKTIGPAPNNQSK